MSQSYALSGTSEARSQQSAVGSAKRAIDAQSTALAKEITREASAQTYFTIRLLTDRPLAGAAYCAYAYFRWVDDILDQAGSAEEERLAFLARQQNIIGRCYRGDPPNDLNPEEELVAELIRSDRDLHSGLHAYISHMMAVMAFDARRKGSVISRDELNDYTRWLATSVTEALHYFIGHGCAAPEGEARYFAVTAAHITHMLRDAIEDTQNGYYNIPRDYLEAHNLSPSAVNNEAHQEWVRGQVNEARALFTAGKANIARAGNFRCRLAGYAYVARFEVVLDAIEEDGYRLRAAYPERKSWHAALKMGASALAQVLQSPRRIDNASATRSNAIKGTA